MQQQNMNPQQAQQQRAQAYIQKVMGALENDPSTLSSTERRFGSKYSEVHQRVRQIENDLTQLREQLRQGEARVKSLELQHQAESGRATAFLESLVSLKFDVEPEDLVPQAPVEEAKGTTEEPKEEVKGDNGTPEPAPRAVAPPVAQA